MANSLIYVHPAAPHNPEDAVLVPRLASVLKKQQQSSWGDIYAAVRQGIVTLTGKVATNRDRQFLVAIARHVPGVLQINDKLTVIDKRNRKAANESDSPAHADPRLRAKKTKVDHFKHLPVVSDDSLRELVTAPEKELLR
jgi:hypothetical protein